MNQSEADLSGSPGPEEKRLDEEQLKRAASTAVHTPTPWVVTGNDFFIRPGPMASAICQCNSHYAEVKENAEFIVRACNAFDDMLEVLEEFYEGFEPTAGLYKRAAEAIEKAKGEG